MSVFRLDPSREDFSELTKKYKVLTLGKQKPKLRYYPNRVTDDIKDKRSYEIYFDKDSKDFSNIEQEIHENYEHSVTDLVASSFNQYISRYAKDEQKNVVYLMYRDD